MPPKTSTVAALVALLPLLALSAPGPSGRANAAGAQAWMRCVAGIPAQFRAAAFAWPNASAACGFGTMRAVDVRRDVLFPDPPFPAHADAAAADGGGATTATATAAEGTTTVHTFIGDSTALRMFIYASNRFLLAPAKRLEYGKLKDAPRFIETVATVSPREPKQWDRGWDAAVHAESDDVWCTPNASASSSFPPADRLGVAAAPSPRRTLTGTRTVKLRFFRMMYVSQASDVVKRALAEAGAPGLLVLSLGNWDLNWKIQKNTPMPGLVGGVHNYTAAKLYWATYVGALRDLLVSALPQLPPSRRPFVVVREQFLPNCAAARFSGKAKRYRECPGLVRPHVVPLYRRTVAATLWPIGVPTIPVDHLFPACTMSDGVHLDFPCMAFEQQLVWNVARLALRRGLRQPIEASTGSDEAPPPAAQWADEATYRRWHAGFFGAPLPPPPPPPPPSPAVDDSTDAPDEPTTPVPSGVASKAIAPTPGDVPAATTGGGRDDDDVDRAIELHHRKRRREKLVTEMWFQGGVALVVFATVVGFTAWLFGACADAGVNTPC